MSWKNSIRPATVEEIKQAEVQMEVPTREGVQEDLETLQDVATVAPQTFLFEHADEALEAISPSLAAEYKQAVKEARERSPIATTAYEVIGPDVLSIATGGASKAAKVEKIKKLLQSARSMALQGAASSAAIQHGSEGEVSAMETVGAGVLSGGMSKLGKMVSGGDIEKSRARYTGMDLLMGSSDFQDTAKRMGMSPIEYTRYLQQQASDIGVFKGGAWDPVSLSFTKPKTASMQGAKRSIFPPTTEAMEANVSQAQDQIGKEIYELLERRSLSPLEGSADFVRTGREGLFTQEDVFPDNLFDELSSDIAFGSQAQEKAVKKQIKYLRDKYFPTEGEINFLQLNELRKDLDRNINWSKAATDDVTRAKNTATLNMRRRLRKLIDETLPEGERLRLLNQRYTEMGQMKDALQIKNTLDFKSRNVLPGQLFAVNPQYGVASGMERGVKARGFEGVAGQMLETGEKFPVLRQSLVENPIRKTLPTALRPDETEEDTQMFTPMRKPQSLVEHLDSRKIPRTTKGMIDNAPLFKAKAAQKFNDPAMLQWVDQQIGDPKKLERNAPAIIQNPLFKDFFEIDEYDRVDGVIPYSLKNKAVRDIELESSDTESMVEKLDKLNRYRRLD